MATTERVAALVTPILEAHGAELYDVELTGATLRVLVDREGGIGLGDLEALSRDVSSALDDDDPLPDQRWYLEVSSPGLERPLRTPRHFRAAVGSTVKVKTHGRVEGDRRVEGTLEDADDEGFTVAGRRIAYDQVDRARTVFEWGPSAKPGGASRKKRSTT
jgi:ribosome maturation factor RimP